MQRLHDRLAHKLMVEEWDSELPQRLLCCSGISIGQVRLQRKQANTLMSSFSVLICRSPLALHSMSYDNG